METRRGRVTLNVGGQRHEVRWKTLEALPQSRLGRIRFAANTNEMAKLCDDINAHDNELFFDRHASSFNAVLNLYRTGKLHLVDDVCTFSFHDDLLYWGIDEYSFESCCHLKYQQRKEAALEEMRKSDEMSNGMSAVGVGGASDEIIMLTPQDFGRFLPKQRCYLWNVMEYPQTSKIAEIIAFLSIFFIIVSSITLTLNTMPEFHIRTIVPANSSSNSQIESHSSSPAASNVIIETDNPIFEIIETVCVCWFTIEFLLRLFATPSILVFLLTPLNMIDLVSILPFYISLAFSQQDAYNNNLNNARRVLTLLRVLRIMRIFKLARHSTGLKSLFYTLKRSYKELGLLLMFLSLAVLIFASLAYFAEKDEPRTRFVSIPAASWWALITITTVGYGDMTPVTTFGKLVGATCCIFGVVLIALPIPIIVSNFTEFYKEQTKRDKMRKYKEQEISDKATRSRAFSLAIFNMSKPNENTKTNNNNNNEAIIFA